MSESERLLKKAGARLVGINTHKVYQLGDQLFNLHNGTRPGSYELMQVKRALRRHQKKEA